jgi:hypothetical protein
MFYWNKKEWTDKLSKNVKKLKAKHRWGLRGGRGRGNIGKFQKTC